MQERWRWTSRTDPSPPAPFLVPFPMAFRPWACMAIPIHTRPATIKDAASVGKEPGSFPMPEPAIPAQAQCHHHAGHGTAGSHPHLDTQLGAPRGCPNSLYTIIQRAKCAQREATRGGEVLLHGAKVAPQGTSSSKEVASGSKAGNQVGAQSLLWPPTALWLLLFPHPTPCPRPGRCAEARGGTAVPLCAPPAWLS